MAEFLFLMHDDAAEPVADTAWTDYLKRLSDDGVLRGGSAIGDGVAHNARTAPPNISQHIVGYLKIEAPDRVAANTYIRGNPVFEAGGTVEIRDLIKTGSD